MLRLFCIGLLATVVYLFAPALHSARGEGLTTAIYVELTLARLRQARDSWEQNAQPPGEDEQKSLLEQYGTTEAEYFAFMNTHRLKVDGYLAGHPEIQAEIQALSDGIRTLIIQKETKQ